MLRRTEIRLAVIEVLRDPSTRVAPDGGVGLTLAQNRVLDTHLDPLSLADCGNGQSVNRDIPAIAVYTEDEALGVSDEAKYDDLCFDRTSLTLVIELYVCAKTGYELERVLDQFESEVRHKLLADRRFYTLAKLRGYQSYPKRSGDGKRLGVRSIKIELQYSQSVRAESHDAPVPLRTRLEFNTPKYKKPGEDPAVTNL